MKSRFYNFTQKVLTQFLLRKNDFTKKGVFTSLFTKRKFQFNSFFWILSRKTFFFYQFIKKTSNLIFIKKVFETLIYENYFQIKFHYLRRDFYLIHFEKIVRKK